jgi:hypothetical protein
MHPGVTALSSGPRPSTPTSGTSGTVAVGLSQLNLHQSKKRGRCASPAHGDVAAEGSDADSLKFLASVASRATDGPSMSS